MLRTLPLLLLLLVLHVPAASQDAVTVVQGASYEPGPMAPGSLASAFGDFPGVPVGTSSDLPLPTVINNVQLLVNDTPAPLMFTSAQQINFQVPQATPLGTVSVRVMLSGSPLASGGMTVRAISPGIFVADANSSTRPGAVLNQDGSINSMSDPASRGSVVSLFLTGQGTDLSSPVNDGEAPGSTQVVTTERPDVFFRVFPAEPQFSGLSPEFPGVWQVNVPIPAESDSLSGQVPVIVVLGGFRSNVASIWVSP